MSDNITDGTLNIKNPSGQKEWEAILNTIKQNNNIKQIKFINKEHNTLDTLLYESYKHQVEIMALLKKRNPEDDRKNYPKKHEILPLIEKKINELHSIWSYVFRRSTAKEKHLMELYKKVYLTGTATPREMYFINPNPNFMNSMKDRDSILNKIEKKISQSEYSLGIFVKRNLSKEQALIALYQQICLLEDITKISTTIDEWEKTNKEILNNDNKNTNNNPKAGFFTHKKEIDIANMLEDIRKIIPEAEAKVYTDMGKMDDNLAKQEKTAADYAKTTSKKFNQNPDVYVTPNPKSN